MDTVWENSMFSCKTHMACHIYNQVLDVHSRIRCGHFGCSFMCVVFT